MELNSTYAASSGGQSEAANAWAPWATTTDDGARAPGKRSILGAHFRRREIRPDVGATPPALLADKAILDVGEPQIVRPGAGVHRDRVATGAVRAIDQDAAHAHVAHVAEGDLLESHGFGP